jgi:Rhodopirellula transposase DDE domain
MKDLEGIHRRSAAVAGVLDERARRAVAAAEALASGWGGRRAVARATGRPRESIALGRKELRGEGPAAPPGRVRRPGGGRTPLAAHDPSVRADLERWVAPSTRGDPESPRRSTRKSGRRWARELQAQGHQISDQKGAALLHALGYRLQAHRQTRAGADHPARDAQCAQSNATSATCLAAGDPGIAVDTQKQARVGDCKHGGREGPPTGQPEAVQGHAFPLPEWGRVSPSGVDDLAANAGGVSVGIDHDTAAFAVAPIGRWWERTGRARSPQAQRLLSTADGGGSHGSRLRLWQSELQQLADQTGLAITGCHFPPGTSKWNQIAPRLFSFIRQNGRGQPLVSDAVIVNLIAATTTTTGLTGDSELDPPRYPTGLTVSDEQMATLRRERDAFHGEWNDTLRPHVA